jgi:hypothetical protein
LNIDFLLEGRRNSSAFDFSKLATLIVGGAHAIELTGWPRLKHLR